MSRLLPLLLLALALVFAACGPTTSPVDLPPAVNQDSGVGAGDLIEIKVVDEEEMSGEYQVEQDGTIRFPKIGAVTVRGRSQGDIAAEIEERLADGWLRDPEVKVVVKERENREFSVLGQVNTPGSYPFKDGLTLLQAISIGGGLNPLAQAKKVQLTRETAKGRETFEIDVTAIIGGSKDPLLAPGDVVFVPESPI